MSDLATAYVQIVPSAQGLRQGLSDIFGSEMPSAGESAGGIFGSNLIGKIKGILSTAAIGTALKETLTAGADLEQSLGGVETLFKESADTVVANAQQAYRTAGMSANSYMEMVTGFSASLLQGLGGDTQAAANIADMALTDMSDNANKMGTAMESIQDAYQGFAKQNYTMLDNLKLGYGGTKTEMERLLADAQTLTGVKYDINNLADVYSAIHAIQTEMGITGTTAQEAATTLTNSFNAMKAAFSDVLGNLALGESLTPSLNALAETTGTFLTGNLVPAVVNIVSALPGACGTLINAILPGNMQEIVTTAVSNFSAFMTEGLPTILSNGEQMVSQFVTGFQNGAPKLMTSLGDLLTKFATSVIEALPSILQSGVNIITELVLGFASGIPSFMASAGSLLKQLLTALLGALPSMLSSGISLVANLASGLISNIPAVIGAAASIIADLLATLGSYLPDLLAQGLALIGEMAAGLIQAIPDVVAAGMDIISSIFDTFGQTDWLSIGKNIVDGIISGLSSAASSLWNAMVGLANSALSAAKSALGINSPSRRFRDVVGKQIPAGMALGIEDNAGVVKSAMHDLSDYTAASFVSNLRMDMGGIRASGSLYSAGTGSYGRSVNIVQNIYSEAKTAADLMQEARYQQELAVMMHV